MSEGDAGFALNPWSSYDRLARVVVITAALRRRETVLGKGSTIRDAVVYHHDAGYANKALDRLQAVTAADVQRVAKTYLGGKPVVITYTSGGAK